MVKLLVGFYFKTQDRLVYHHIHQRLFVIFTCIITQNNELMMKKAEE